MNNRLLILASLLISGAAAGGASAGAPSVQASMNDASLTKSVQNQLDMVSYLKADGVRAQTIDHVVYIRGTVDTYPQSANAKAVAQRAAGAAPVVNLIDVANGGG
jgi:osmotically-inducible protein OsmY